MLSANVSRFWVRGMKGFKYFIRDQKYLHCSCCNILFLLPAALYALITQLFPGSRILPESDINCFREDGRSIFVSLHHRGLRHADQRPGQHPAQEEAHHHQPRHPVRGPRGDRARGLRGHFGPRPHRGHLDIHGPDYPHG